MHRETAYRHLRFSDKDGTDVTVDEYKRLTSKKTSHTAKYRSQKIKTPDGTFDSAKEYNRWCELKLLERAGKITGLKRQVKYELIPAQYDKKGNIIERAVSYKADFVYQNNDQETIVEDTKGLRTKEYILKRKLMLWVHGIQVKEL